MTHAVQAYPMDENFRKHASRAGIAGLRGMPEGLALCCVAALSMLSTLTARADAVSYSGKVVDGLGAGIPWAFIKVQGSDLIGQSGADGGFTITTNTAAATYYADPKPAAPFRNPASDLAALPRFLLTGRAASGSYVAATLLLTGSGEDSHAAKSFYPTRSERTAGAASAARIAHSASDATDDDAAGNAGDPRPPAPPALAKSAAAFTLSVTMARYQPGSFPQSAATAKNLVLTLVPSATDTAAYASEKKLCLDTVNAFRASLNLKPVAWSTSLEAFADQGARYDSERNVAHGHFGAFSIRAVPADAENAIPGWPLKNYKTVAKVVAEGAKMMWAEGPGGGHYENIAGNQTVLGCGIYVNPAGGVWVIHDFK